MYPAMSPQQVIDQMIVDEMTEEEAIAQFELDEEIEKLLAKYDKITGEVIDLDELEMTNGY